MVRACVFVSRSDTYSATMLNGGETDVNMVTHVRDHVMHTGDADVCSSGERVCIVVWLFAD